ncbi:MAG: Jag N-terminal domain-containing protein [Proteobacteria bacterium]|nr:Jag N-terminal domain-containing protein [Pseudomonadota bacterium]MBU1687630.1 Jag N-terminal domain-containing protein [Pseudomonadota bacterium]
MSEKIKYSGKDVTEAISMACSALNVSQDQLAIDVLSPGSAGLFGLGRKKAMIAVSIKGSARTATEPAETTEHKRPRKEGGRRRQPSQSSPRAPRRAASSESSHEPATITNVDLDWIKNHLVKILAMVGFPVEVTITSNDNKIKAHITGAAMEEVVGSEGQTLDSLQYLMRKIISRRIQGRVMFSLDAGDYRDRRRQDLEEQADTLAAEVRESGRTKSIPALNPAERRIVHMRLQDDTSIRSRSVGEGHFKKILIYVPGRKKR